MWTPRSQSSTSTSFIAPLKTSTARGGYSYSCVNCADHFTGAGQQQPAALTVSTEEVSMHGAVSQRVKIKLHTIALMPLISFTRICCEKRGMWTELNNQSTRRPLWTDCLVSKNCSTWLQPKVRCHRAADCTTVFPTPQQWKCLFFPFFFFLVVQAASPRQSKQKKWHFAIF